MQHKNTVFENIARSAEYLSQTVWRGTLAWLFQIHNSPIVITIARRRIPSSHTRTHQQQYESHGRVSLITTHAEYTYVATPHHQHRASSLAHRLTAPASTPSASYVVVPLWFGEGIRETSTSSRATLFRTHLRAIKNTHALCCNAPWCVLLSRLLLFKISHWMGRARS